MKSLDTILPLIDIFKVCPIDDKTYSDDEKIKIVSTCLSSGLIVDYNAINNYASEYAIKYKMKYNSTFYKTWSDVSNKTRLSLLVDQLLHYSTAYSNDEFFWPNREANEPEWTEYKKIDAITFAELYDRCIGMLSSGIALKSETVKNITHYVIEYYKENKPSIDLDAIKNREAMIIICDELGILPTNGDKLFSYIVYKATGDTMIVKNRELRHKIRANAEKVELLFKNLNEKQLIALASVFNRYKHQFVSFKTRISSKAINKISRLSKKYHKPMKRGFWENILSNKDVTYEELIKEAENATNFKLIQVMQSVRERLLTIYEKGNKLHIIRNGKVFFKDIDAANSEDSKTLQHLAQIYSLCLKQVTKNISSKACKVKMPKQYELTCPTSEKNFIGDVPIGTNVAIGENSVIGIYWRNEWGTHDFDLSYTNMSGERLAWNSKYKESDDSAIYSGDMTQAYDGANEVILFRKNIKNGLIKVNRYNGVAGSKYKLFFGTDKLENILNNDMKNYMVDPNNIQLEAEIHQGEMREQMIGLICDGKYYFLDMSCGYSMVSSAMHIKAYKDKQNITLQDINEDVINTVKRKAVSAVPLAGILSSAGFEFVENDPDIDLTKLSRDTLIELFTK